MTDTGPPYPHGPLPGSNAIGLFIIGVSPIGDIPAFDFWVTVLSQYANSTILTQLIEDFSGYLDPTASLDAFFDLVWNVDTAAGYGLDVWGRIVGVSRVLSLGASPFFGLEDPAGDAASGDPFNVSPFYAGVNLTTNFSLTDEAYRPLILAKALANISDGSIPAINQLLQNLFPNHGNSFVVDNEDMTMVYRFEFDPTPVERAIISQSGVLPQPTGVAVAYTFGI